MNQSNQESEDVSYTDSPTSPLQKIDQNLSGIFGTEPMDLTIIKEETTSIQSIEPEEGLDIENIETDSSFVRSNMYSLMQQGQDALEYALELAKQSDSPRAFEVVGALMKQLADMNMQLLDSHEKKQKLSQKTKPAETPGKVVNNSIVFNGSTADLNKMLSDMRKENE